MSRLLGLVLFVVAGTSFAQDLGSQLRYYQRNTEYVLDSAARHVRRALSSDERRVQASVELVVPAESAMIAQAVPGRTVISAGFAWILEQLAVSHVADYEIGHSGCDEQYTLYLGELIASNSHRYVESRTLQPALSPEGYGRKYGGDCEGFRTEEIGESGNGDYFARLVEASLMFLYLHELAHHVLGHVETPPPNNDFSRKDEAEADAWAIETGFRADFNVMVGAPMMNLLGVLGGASLEAERKQTHPLGMRRVRDMLLRAREILFDKGADDEIIEWIDDNIETVESRWPSR